MNAQASRLTTAFNIIMGCILLLTLSVAVGPRAAASPALAERSQAEGTVPIRLEGYVKAIGPGKWLVGAWTILVDGQTAVIEKRGPAEVGAWVVVAGRLDASGAIYAETIIVDRPADLSAPIRQFSGVLSKQVKETQRDVELWVIGEMLVEVTADTQIVGAPTRGWLVWVVAEEAGNALRAIMVEAIAETPVSVPVEFEGVLEVYGPDSGRADGHVFTIAPSAVKIGELAVGEMVEIVAVQDTLGNLVAHTLRVVDASAEAGVGAMVTAIIDEGDGEQSWEVIAFPPQPWAEPLLATVRLGRNTWVDESRAVVMPGLWADVRGVEIGQGEIQADVIRLDQPVPVLLEGRLEPMLAGGSNWWQMNGQAVWLNLGRQVQTTALTGQHFTLRGVRLGNGVIWVNQLQQLEAPARPPMH